VKLFASSQGEEMELYNEIIHNCLALIESHRVRKYAAEPDNLNWKLESEQKLIFQKEMAYELGGGGRPAIGGLCFMGSDDFINEIWVVGDDLPDLKKDSPYARISILNVDDSSWNDSQKAYNSMRKIDYTRYHVYPEGFMMRISTSAKREPVRIAKKALKKGLDFQKVGNLFINRYLQQADVKGVKIIFITEESFDYETLEKYVNKMESVTNSLDKIFNNLIMDCRSCNLKPVCDEVEGLREYHKGLSTFQ